MISATLERRISDEFEIEPVRGLPEVLPAGERLLWQGAPDWRALSLRVFHVRKAAIYFGALLIWRMASALGDGQSLTASVGAAARLLPYAVAALGILTLLAWLTSRTTVYSVTDRRIVLRIGIALPMTINIPFVKIASADARLFADGTGDIPVRLVPPDRIAFLLLWPHCRPWRVARPEPMLRGVADAKAVASALAAAASSSKISAQQKPVAASETAPKLLPVDVA